MPLRKRFLRRLSFPLRFQEYELKTIPSHPRLAWNKPLVVLELKPGAIPVSQRQYYVPHKAQIGIQKHLDRLLMYGIL
jgi:hypothetical protein